MAVNEESLAARYRAENAQNKKVPFLIHIDDGRLVPNVPRLGGRKELRDAAGRMLQTGIAPHPKYRPYMGDPKAPLATRLRDLRVGMAVEEAPVGDGQFDIATADREELRNFALTQYGVDLDSKGNTPLPLLRGKVKALAEKSGDLNPSGGLT